MTEFPHPGQLLARFRRRATVAMLFVLICFGVLVARLWGAQDGAAVSRAVHTSVSLAVIGVSAPEKM